MDAHRFDSLIRSFSTPQTRRGMLLRVAGGLLAAVPLARGVDDAEAKKRNKRKKRNKKKGGKGGPTPPPPPPGVTCSDGSKNGNESDVDCGGPDCPPCGNGRLCGSNTDCATARCGNNNICQSCSIDGLCGSDENGVCACDEGLGICFTDVTPNTFENECPTCPAGSACRIYFEGFACVPLCGG